MRAFIFFLLLFSSCSVERAQRRHCAKCPSKEVKSDSTWYKKFVEYRDSVISIPADKAQLEYKFMPCPDGSVPKVKSIKEKSGKQIEVESTYNESNGILKVAALIPERKDTFKLPEVIIESGTKKEGTIVKQPPPKWTDCLPVFIMGLLTGATSIFLIFHFRKSKF